MLESKMVDGMIVIERVVPKLAGLSFCKKGEMSSLATRHYHKILQNLNKELNTALAEINRPGFAHIAFEVDDVEITLAEIINAGGSRVGELVTADYPNNIEAVFVYARDPEGNIIELQSWRNINNI